MAGAFRTPSLRCDATHPSFMHTGQLRTVADVIAFFDAAVIRPVRTRVTPSCGRSGQCRRAGDLAAFLAALDGPGPDASLLVPPK